MSEITPMERLIASRRSLIALGPLEAELMRLLWDQGTLTVRDAYEQMRLRRRISYTTVMAVLSNLAGKGLVSQDRSQSAYRYSAQVSDLEVAQVALDVLTESVMGGRVEPLIAYLRAKSESSPAPPG